MTLNPPYAHCLVNLAHIALFMKFLLMLPFLCSFFLISACSTVREKIPSFEEVSSKAPKVTVEKPNRSTFIEAAKIPMYSVNLIREEIPEYLEDITVSYQAPKNCLDYRVEMVLLNEALGEDPIDKTSDSDKVITLQLGKMIAREVESNIPFNSIIRSISGAKKHQRALLAARLKGNARRSYLKGWAAAKPCA